MTPTKKIFIVDYLSRTCVCLYSTKHEDVPTCSNLENCQRITTNEKITDNQNNRVSKNAII